MEAFEDMCRTLLADVQQRLIYRAHVYIKSQIQDYEPSAGDLAYPEKLEMIEVGLLHCVEIVARVSIIILIIS